jgi:hypothetical protein
MGRTLRALIEVLVDVDVEFGAGDEIVRINDESGEVIGYVTGLDVQGGVPWLSFQRADVA